MKKTKAVTDSSTSAVVENAVREIKQALSTVATHEIPARYRIGARVEEFRREKKKYGRKVVVTIAEEVGLTPSALYQYADVARIWEKAAFDDVGRRAAVAGLMFSHFVELAHKGHAEHRNALLEEAIDGQLSVRALRDRRDAPRRPQIDSSASAAKLAAEGPELTDILERLAAEGPTAEIRSTIDAELEELHRRDADLQRRVEQLQAARAQWAPQMPTVESSTDFGKAAE